MSYTKSEINLAFVSKMKVPLLLCVTSIVSKWQKLLSGAKISHASSFCCLQQHANLSPREPAPVIFHQEKSATPLLVSGIKCPSIKKLKNTCTQIDHSEQSNPFITMTMTRHQERETVYGINDAKRNVNGCLLSRLLLTLRLSRGFAWFSDWSYDMLPYGKKRSSVQIPNVLKHPQLKLPPTIAYGIRNKSKGTCRQICICNSHLIS